MSSAMEPPQWRKDLHCAAKFMGKSVPVNKSSSSTAQGRRLPEVHSRLMQRVLTFGSVGLGALTKRLHPERRSGRAERFQALMVRALVERWGSASGDFNVDVRVDESFGKPALISIDVAVKGIGSGVGRNENSLEGSAYPRVDAAEGAAIVELCLKEAWNNPEIAPVAVRVSVRSGEDMAACGASGPVIASAKTVGFADETARPSELYQRFGAPAFDPVWKP